MRRVNRVVFTLIAILGLAIAGCSKNESSTASGADQAKAVEKVNQANQILVPRMAILISSQGQDTSVMNMSAATSLYKEALSYDPNNPDAHFGLAVSEFITVFSDPSLQSALGKRGASASQGVLGAIFGKGSVLSGVSSIINRQLKSTTNSLLTPIFKVQKHEALAIGTTGEPVSYYQGMVETKVLPVLSDAITHLNEVTKHSDYAFYITPAELGEEVGDSIRIGLTEVYAVLAVCQLVDAGASAFVSYNVDYNSTDSAAVRQAWTSGSSFLALRSGGAQRMKDARTNFVGALTSVQNGIQFLEQHPGAGIIPYRPEDQAQLDLISNAIDSVKTVLSGPVQVTGDLNSDGTQENVRLDLSKLFDNPIQDFKQ